jgi:hypothetical protein
MKTEGSYKPLEQPIAASNLQIVEIKCRDVDENEIVLTFEGLDCHWHTTRENQNPIFSW